MRIIVNCSGLFVFMAMIILIHSSIINTHIRDSEIRTGLESSTDYALDCMRDTYATINYDPSQNDVYVNQLLTTFCTSLEKMIGTDGEIKVSVLAADVATGTFDFVVEETFNYSSGRTGKSVCERAVTFSA